MRCAVLGLVEDENKGMLPSFPLLLRDGGWYGNRVYQADQSKIVERNTCILRLYIMMCTSDQRIDNALDDALQLPAFIDDLHHVLLFAQLLRNCSVESYFVSIF